MEALSRLVRESLAQNGVNTALNHQRLEWSRWFRCESSFSVLLAPSKPGIFTLGEEIVPVVDGSKRMLALFEIAETGDLGIALGRLFLPGSPLRKRLESGRCFARYTVIEDAAERASAYGSLRRWMEQSTEKASGFGSGGVDTPIRDSSHVSEPVLARNVVGAEVEPSVSFALETKVHARRNCETA
jgi:hypothetical protein